jgi:hypothetical protein
MVSHLVPATLAASGLAIHFNIFFVLLDHSPADPGLSYA